MVVLGFFKNWIREDGGISSAWAIYQRSVNSGKISKRNLDNQDTQDYQKLDNQEAIITRLTAEMRV